MDRKILKIKAWCAHNLCQNHHRLERNQIYGLMEVKWIWTNKMSLVEICLAVRLDSNQKVIYPCQALYQTQYLEATFQILKAQVDQIYRWKSIILNRMIKKSLKDFLINLTKIKNRKNL